MANVAILSEDLDAAPWELVQNEVHELETSRGAADPDPKFVGFDGESLFTKYLKDQQGNPLQLFMQATWTAIDQTLQFQHGRRDFDPEIRILDVRLVGADEPIYLLDEPHEAIDPDYTWQGVFEAERDYQVEEALADVGGDLYHRM